MALRAVGALGGWCRSVTWWRRWHGGSDDELDNNHLMRLAGRFARRVRAWGNAHGVEIIDCKAEERKHRIAEDYLASHDVGTGVFLILVARAPATVWDVRRSKTRGHIGNLAKKKSYVNHYSFHIMDPEFGHVTIKMSGHAPFSAQVIVNGHEFVAAQAGAAGIGYTKEGNCFTATADPVGLARIADTWSTPSIVGRLGQVCDRWIYTACLCFGLDLTDQDRSGFRYSYSIYQVEYSRNLIFASGARLDSVFESMLDRTRSRLDVPKVRTMFGAKGRPHRKGGDLSPRQGMVIETPRWDLTIFKVHFGLLTLKAYSKGEHVLRFEAVVHNTRQLGTGRVLDRFPVIVDRLRSMVERFLTMLDCVDVGFIADGTLDQLPFPSRLGATRVGGIDLKQAASPSCPGRHHRLVGRTRRVHRGRPGHQGQRHGRPGRHRLHRSPSCLRHPKATRQAARHQARPHPALSGPTRRRPNHQRRRGAPGPGHRPHPRRGAQPPPRTSTGHLDPDRPRLRDPPHRHATPLQRPPPAHSRIDNILSMEEPQAPSEASVGLPRPSSASGGVAPDP